MGMGSFQMQSTCPHCRGKGKVSALNCQQCGGHKVELKEQEIEIKVPKGSVHGDKFRYDSMANQIPDVNPGNVVITLQEQKHPHYHREGQTLFNNQTLTLQ
jgi:DnaJ-class molecular chaperone